MSPHHIGYIVKEIEPTQTAFTSLGYVPEGVCTQDELRRVDILFMRNEAVRIELIAPWDEESVCWSILKTRGGGNPYHICYEVADIETEGVRLAKDGWMLVAPSAPAPALGERHVAFFFHRVAGLIELVEKE